MVAEQHTNTISSKMWDRVSHLAASPLTFFCLAAVTLALAAKLALLYTALAAPAISGWSWSEHPNTLLIAYRSSTCGCGAHLTDAISQGVKHNADVVVMASAADATDASLAPIRVDRRVRILSGVSSQTLSHLLPKGGTAILNVQRGRITHQTTGSVLPDGFFK